MRNEHGPRRADTAPASGCAAATRRRGVAFTFVCLSLSLGACQEETGLLVVDLERTRLTAFVGERDTTALLVRNDGEAAFTFQEFVFTETPPMTAGPQFEITPYAREQVVEPGETLRFQVTFHPLEVGEAQADILLSTSVGRTSVSTIGEGRNNPPVVTLSQDIPRVVCAGEPFAVLATVTDVEDAGDPTAVAVALASDVEGDLATGWVQADGTFQTDVVLTVEGSQTLTLTATDSFGDTGRAGVAVDVSSSSGQGDASGACRF